ncbi:MAG: hypothetical protein Q4F30_06465 [Akkermansia sp.]|nr:hypothetical protein [Akkermansia sp.]
MPRKRHLTIEEKRDWLAVIFRDEEGTYSQADKFKAMVEDTRLAELEQEKAAAAPPEQKEDPTDILAHLPPPLP